MSVPIFDKYALQSSSSRRWKGTAKIFLENALPQSFVREVGSNPGQPDHSIVAILHKNTKLLLDTASNKALVMNMYAKLCLLVGSGPYEHTWGILDRSEEGSRLAWGLWIERGYLAPPKGKEVYQSTNDWDWESAFRPQVLDDPERSTLIQEFLERRPGNRWAYVLLSDEDRESPEYAVFRYVDNVLLEHRYKPIEGSMNLTEPVGADIGRILHCIADQEKDSSAWNTFLLLERVDPGVISTSNLESQMLKTLRELIPLRNLCTRPEFAF